MGRIGGAGEDQRNAALAGVNALDGGAIGGKFGRGGPLPLDPDQRPGTAVETTVAKTLAAQSSTDANPPCTPFMS